MEVSILQEKFIKGLNAVLKTVSNKPTLPILANVLISAESGRLELFTTDLNMGVRIWIGSKVKSEGKVTIPAKLLSDVIGSFMPATVNISVKDNSMKLACADSKIRLSGTAASEYPSLGKVEEKASFELDANQFKDAVERVVFAAASDETRPILSGVLWKVQGSSVQLVATDGYRLSLATLGNEKGEKKDKWLKKVKAIIGDGMIIPARAIKDVERLIEEFGAKEIKLGLVKDQNLVVFNFGECEVTTRLIEGAFPNYGQVIPKEEVKPVKIDVEALTKAVRTAAIFARDSANIVHWKINDNLLIVSANAPSFGESESSIDVITDGQSGEIAFNSRYLLEFLSILKSKKIDFAFKGSLDPGVFKSEDKTKEDFLHLIMPVRIQK